MSGHTYEKWQELGYQVKRGEKAAYEYYGNYIFTRDQVVSISGEEEAYVNHCWSCGRTVDSDYCNKCSSCGWYECNKCGSCSSDCEEDEDDEYGYEEEYEEEY